MNATEQVESQVDKLNQKRSRKQRSARGAAASEQPKVKGADLQQTVATKIHTIQAVTGQAETPGVPCEGYTVQPITGQERAPSVGSLQHKV